MYCWIEELRKNRKKAPQNFRAPGVFKGAHVPKLFMSHYVSMLLPTSTFQEVQGYRETKSKLAPHQQPKRENYGEV